MALYPEPHSKDCFNALDAFDPQQAAHTRQILKSAGRPDVCSICGDHPATDFKIAGKSSVPANAVASIRLCADCRQLRADMLDEVYEPFEE